MWIKRYSDDQINEAEMDGTCNMYERGEKCIYSFNSKTWNNEVISKNLDVRGR